MAVEISRLSEEDIPGAIDTIQQAFADDPYKRWIYDDREKMSLSRNRVSLGIRCRWGIRNALFYVAKDSTTKQVLGVAMWLPPRVLAKAETWDEWGQNWLLWLKQVGMNLYYGRGGLNVKRYYTWKKNQAVAQKELWTDPRGYYFCNIVTVLPPFQGQGIGGKLFRAVTDQADQKGLRCYLESSKDRPNTAIYEKLGFRMVKDIDCDDDGVACRLFCMIREPKSSSSPVNNTDG